jgi:hypothetical protein
MRFLKKQRVRIDSVALRYEQMMGYFRMQQAIFGFHGVISQVKIFLYSFLKLW